MAISLGDAVLAFAGGAAQQYNVIEDEKRQSNLRMKERAQQLLDNAALKQAETEHAMELNEYQKNKSLLTALKSTGGPNTLSGQIAIAEHAGIDKEIFLREMFMGDTPKLLSVPEISSKAPVPLNDRAFEYLSATYPEAARKLGRRMSPKLKGTMFNDKGEGIPRSLRTKEDGSVADIDVLKGLGFTEEDSAGYLQDISQMNKAERDTLARRLLGEDSPWQPKVMSDGRVLWTNAETRETIEDKRYQQREPTVWETKEDVNGYLRYLNGPMKGKIVEGYNVPKQDAGNVRFSELTVNGTTQEVMSVYGMDESGRYRITQQIPLGEKPIRDMKVSEGRKQLNEELYISGQVMDTVTRMQDYVDIKLSGVGGTITSIEGAVTDLIDSVPGVSPSFYKEGDAIDATTLSNYMANDFVPEDQERASTLFEQRISQGKIQALESLLIYNYAKLLKPEGKLNVDDIQRAEDVLGTGFKGGAGYAGAVSLIRDTARGKAVARIRQYVRTINPEGNFTGQVVWDPETSAWRYKLVKDGKEVWETVN